ncbi:MAG: hypothetical protein R2745_17515, partial [Vicinamibacterales bacterium]
MRRVVLVLCASVLSACGPSAHPAATVSGAGGPGTAVPGAAYRSEQEWVVWSMAEHAGRVAGLTGTQPPHGLRVAAEADATVPRFALEAEGRQAGTIALATHLWDPRGARQVVEVVAPGVLAAPGSAGPPEIQDARRLLDRLTSPTLDVLFDEDRRVSSALRASPRSAALHEQAALLLAVFALRDGAGTFSDYRDPLSRLAVHLAVAGPEAQTPAGRVAAALLLALVGRERDARTAAEALGAEDGAIERTWSRVVALRASNDWRLLEHPASATLVERLTHARAVFTRLGSQRMLSYVSPGDSTDGPEWARVALMGPFSVDAGNRFGAIGLALEFAEAQRAIAEYRGRAVEDDAVARVLAEAGPRPEDDYRVLAWPLWRSSAARHLAGRLVSAAGHLRNQGLEADVQPMIDAALAADGGGLASLPTIILAAALASNDDAVPRRTLESAAREVAAHPDACPPGAWAALSTRAAKVVLPWPQYTGWFRPATPFGTAMELAERGLRRNARPEAPLEEAEGYHALAPSDYWAAYAVMRLRTAGKPTLASFREHVGPIVEFDVNPLRFLMDYVARTDGELVAVASSLCALDGDRCQRLAEVHLAEGREDEAASAYDQWFDAASDRVAAANGIRWAVLYHLDQGHRDRALVVAARAGATGAAGGLEVQGNVLERIGRLDEAEAVYRQTADRYTGWKALPAAYYLRRWLSTRDASLRARAMPLLSEPFPNGLESLVKPDLPPVPTDGVRLVTFGLRQERAGLRRGDIIVGIDGYRARTAAQYQWLMRMSWEPR